jgi:hypothetical protein
MDWLLCPVLLTGFSGVFFNILPGNIQRGSLYFPAIA